MIAFRFELNSNVVNSYSNVIQLFVSLFSIIRQTVCLDTSLIVCLRYKHCIQCSFPKLRPLRPTSSCRVGLNSEIYLPYIEMKYVGPKISYCTYMKVKMDSKMLSVILVSSNLGSSNLGLSNLGSSNLRLSNLRSSNLRLSNIRSSNLRWTYLAWSSVVQYYYLQLFLVQVVLCLTCWVYMGSLLSR